MLRFRALFLFPLLLIAAGCAWRPPAAPLPAAEARLVTALGDRLALAREVAWIKYRNGLPVRDPVREAAVLARVETDAPAARVRPEQARVVFAAQIAASCAEQEALLRQWRRGAPLPTLAPRDLAGGVRADIDRANTALLAALAAAEPVSPDFRLRAEADLRSWGFSPAAARLAVGPFAAPGRAGE